MLPVHAEKRATIFSITIPPLIFTVGIRKGKLLTIVTFSNRLTIQLFHNTITIKVIISYEELVEQIIKRKNLVDSVVELFLRKMEKGVLKSGNLPSQEELARNFSVSRIVM